MDADNDFINAIAPDVLKALEDKRFFDILDDQMCPKDPSSARVLCQGTLAVTTTTLINCGFDKEAIADILAVLADRGGFCDCEVLYNVAEKSGLKSEFWMAVASKRRPLHEHSPGAHPKQQRVRSGFGFSLKRTRWDTQNRKTGRTSGLSRPATGGLSSIAFPSSQRELQEEIR